MARQGYDVLVIGGGPAGLAAAATAAESGRRVAVLDDNPNLGGQIWRQAASVELHCATTLAFAAEDRSLLVESPQGAMHLQAETLIIALGARERFLPFPGWTLPGVMGVGGLQALVKSGFDVQGLRIAIAGSGPLLLAVAAYLRQHQAQVVCVAEQAPLMRTAAFAAGLWRQPKKLAQLAGLQKALLGVPKWYSSWPVEVLGDEKVEGLRLQNRELACDLVATGFGLLPDTSVAESMGCELRGAAVQVDAQQQTSQAQVYAAGECTGIGGVDVALLEGQIAGHAAVGQEAQAKELFAKRKRLQAFANGLERAFALRDELRQMVQADTVLCRCEDVPWSAIEPLHSMREAKLQTRCGMGPCQGRVCGAALEFLKGWQPERRRPPLLPMSVAAMTQGIEK